MKCSACKELCGNYYCSYTREDYLNKDVNIDFMRYYDITYDEATSSAYKDAYDAFVWSYNRGVEVRKWINY